MTLKTFPEHDFQDTGQMCSGGHKLEVCANCHRASCVSGVDCWIAETDHFMTFTQSNYESMGMLYTYECTACKESPNRPWKFTMLGTPHCCPECGSLDTITGSVPEEVFRKL